MDRLVNAPIHTGSELGRAINKTDFFRLFKSAAKHHGYDFFFLVRHPALYETFDSDRDLLLDCLPDDMYFSLPKILGSDFPGIADRLLAKAVPQVTALGSDPESSDATGINQLFHRNCIISVPLVGPDGRFYSFVAGGDRLKPDHMELADCMLALMEIFKNYHDTLIAHEREGLFTPREIEIVKWSSDGKNSSEIALILGVSEHTVNDDIATLLKKLNAENRVHMVANAMRYGIIN
jgi:DNA-binding CsgD family transcriptional regulator